MEGGGRSSSGEWEGKMKKKKKVLLEGYMDDEDVGRSKSLTDDDLEELKGCLDLGFGFSYEEIPELCNTLPALELCYSMSPSSSSSSVLGNWKISSPGDHPEDVKARLKYWAQAVACTVKLCSQRNECDPSYTIQPRIERWCFSGDLWSSNLTCLYIPFQTQLTN